ncbi:ribonuclease Y [Jeotgalibaca sp. PTS2502]|uniref:Ribonuclease Y n=1 Tax=Candidatus Jeotgalibaca merdavium TaxID=2838627 RepID=A0A9D2I2D7_9LACT|nr:ribonuclease Y [Jeotgalibaca sp. PTS2502]APZ48893.1 ribonuclease Y [Jeotgalibaca sp. PTS2502]HJA90772.1 ribonuclease Y [Candidatus Jeotgalibaca merdavium]
MGLIEIAFAIIALIIGVVIGYFYRKSNHEKELAGARNTATSILEEAAKDAETMKKEAMLEAKEESHQYRSTIEEELRERRNDVLKQENRMIQKEENLDRKENTLSKREKTIENKEENLAKRNQTLTSEENRIQTIIEEQQQELERIATMSREDAKAIIMKETEEQLTYERAVLVKESEQRAKDESERKAKNIILQAIQRSSADLVSEATVTVVTLPNDDMKGRIIGREGRNIRTLETLTGIDLIIDDTPEAVVLSGFDPIRRETAKIALERLIQDGRIHPARIEEAVDRARKEMDERIREIGEQATFEVGIHSLHPDLIKILGRMYFRTSYGQNVLNHSIEVAKLAGVMAGELGEDITMAKRAGLLHDIGKALDHEIEGSHVEIGAEIAQRYKENAIVVNAIASHHGDVEPTNIISILVAAADALSAARPGARSESLENYIRRLERLEGIANEFDGVSSSFAIQAGREIRIMVSPENVDDSHAILLARDIKTKIEEELEYPGHIKVTVIRETRAIEYAK